MRQELQNVYFSTCEQTNREGCFMVCHETDNATVVCRNVILLADYFLETMSKGKLCSGILECKKPAVLPTFSFLLWK